MADDVTTTVDPPAEATDQVLDAPLDSQESEPVVEELVQDASPEEGAAEAASAFSWTDVPDDDLMAQLRERKDGSGLTLEDRLRKSERDRERERIRREQGSNDRAQAYHTWLTEQIDSGKSAEEIAKQTPTFVKANEEFVTAQLGSAWAKATLDHFDVQDREVLNTVIDGYVESGNVEDMNALAGKLWEAAKSKVEQSAVLNIESVEDVPKDSKLYASMRKWHEEELGKEIAAREAEARGTTENPPRTPQGSVPAGSERYIDMPAREASALPDEEYKAWQRVQAGVA
jgi:hypothetical protein